MHSMHGEKTLTTCLGLGFGDQKKAVWLHCSFNLSGTVSTFMYFFMKPFYTYLMYICH